MTEVRSLSYRNQSIDLQNKSADWFLYDRDLLQERVKFGQNFRVVLLFSCTKRVHSIYSIFVGINVV